MLPTIELARPEAAQSSVLSRGEAASLLGVSVNTVSKLLESGFLPGLEASGVMVLARAPQVRVTEGVLPVLRTGAPAAPTREGTTGR
ncbi:helix-turn-helix domain-containing protein [Streptomyces sp. MNU103]|uniref:helix-turn-helix domain-containing protein n=1 Tax=Streptomyces sp. MNU103 TaxID=2560024 RepID=UPI001E5BACD7|nr:helix-turn-helix domain-containing protein [Streptomyces sp. MNU103]